MIERDKAVSTFLSGFNAPSAKPAKLAQMFVNANFMPRSASKRPTLGELPFHQESLWELTFPANLE